MDPETTPWVAFELIIPGAQIQPGKPDGFHPLEDFLKHDDPG